MHRIGLTLLGLLFVILWSSGWTASHYAITSTSAFSILCARYALVVLVLLVVVTLFRQWQRLPVTEITFHLLIGALCHGLYLLGCLSAFELGVSASVVAFVNALQPMTTASLTGSVTGEQVKPRHWKGLILGMLSVVLIISNSYQQSGVPSYALALPFISMLAFSTGLVLNRRQEMKRHASKRRARPLMLLLLIHTCGALLIIAPLAAARGELEWTFTSAEWTAIVWLALVVSLGSYALVLFLSRYISAVRVSSLTYLVPPATMLQCYFLFGETLTVTHAAALFLAGVSVYLILSKSNESPDTDAIDSNAICKRCIRMYCVNGRQSLKLSRFHRQQRLPAEVLSNTPAVCNKIVAKRQRFLTCNSRRLSRISLEHL
ncbi:MAG: DMT family transporter [Granulosicoccus sp.]